MNNMDISKLLYEIAQSEHEQYKMFKQKLTEYCTNRKNSVIGLFRYLKTVEIELNEYLSGRIRLVVDIDRAIIVKVLKTIRIELDIIRYRMKHPELSMQELTKSLEHVGKLKWRGSVVEWVELIYALHAIGYVNDGKISLKEMFYEMGEVFDIEVKDFSRTFMDIKIRSDRTLFLDELKRVLIERIEKADEKPARK